MSWYRKVFERIAPHYFRTALRVISLVLVLTFWILFGATILFGLELFFYLLLMVGWFLFLFQPVPVVFESHLAIDDFIRFKAEELFPRVVFWIVAGLWFSVWIFVLPRMYMIYDEMESLLLIAFLVYIPFVFVLGLVLLIKLNITRRAKIFRFSLTVLYFLDVLLWFIILAHSGN